MQKANLFSAVILLVLSQQCALGRYFNLTEYLEQPRYPTHERNWGIHRSYSPLVIPRDVSYLPEDDYDNQGDSDTVEKIEEETQRQLERNDRNLRPEYRNLCETRTRKVQLSDDEFEYQPPHYHEIYCKSYALIDHSVRNPVKPPRQLCAHPGFHCVQRSRTISLVRRRWSDTCWEAIGKEIASGCDCMWPVANLGDITAHY
ncbi:uncharacterized protein LOC107035790 [Diachasma alloeum]|uniref:uncharacterized protein LOC107035790 n=1 Tax=Diachasma alloeum TaxID=454923 RepID=UPI0007382201|nr:uncharacterized protein LOC107035790 [Diachasma alloeum]